MDGTRTTAVAVVLTVARDVTNEQVAEALFNFLCGGGDEPWPEEIIMSCDAAEWSRSY